jgi:hypothetical protein
MSPSSFRWTAVVLALAGLPAVAMSQTGEPSPQVLAAAPDAPPDRPDGWRRNLPPTQMRVEIVLSRYRGGQKVSDVSQSLLLTDDKARSGLRMAINKDGLNIDCEAEEEKAGYFPIHIKLENSSTYLTKPSEAQPGVSRPRSASASPLARSFNMFAKVLLRDGERLQIASSEDQVSGEALKVEVMLTVLNPSGPGRIR